MSHMERMMDQLMDQTRTLDPEELLERKQKAADRERLRDHFAGLAMQGYIQSADFSSLGRVGITDEEFDKMIAKSAYDTADAMLVAREKFARRPCGKLEKI